MPRQIGTFQRAVITGTTGGVTGGTIVPSGSVLAVWDIEYSELNTTGNSVRVRGMPSTRDVDTAWAAVGANNNLLGSSRPKAVLPAGDVLQVLTTNTGSVVAKITYTIEDPANFL